MELCIVCNQDKYSCHEDAPPHAAKPTCLPCPGFANVQGAEGPTYDPGGGSSGGGGASGSW